MAAIEVTALSKRFGGVDAVHDLTFAVPEGAVTGFLGPNGAGKTTTLRMVLGLVTPTSGDATIAGRRYADLPSPSRIVGAVLEASNAHPARTARDHLRIVAQAAGITESRVDEVLAMVELSGDSRRRVRGFSFGMRQRLGLATALLGDPGVLILDEPANGLDPAGVRWLRDLLRGLSRQGRSVLVSSHLLAEVAQTVDYVVIIDHGRLVVDCPLGDLATLARSGVRVRAPEAGRLREVLSREGHEVELVSGDQVFVAGATPEAVGRAIAGAGLVVYEMSLEGGSLEEVFLHLTDQQKESVR